MTHDDAPYDLPVVVITGASSGIGRASALCFASRGARLVLGARDEAALETLVGLCETYGTRALAVPTDVTDPDSVRALAEAALRFGGHIDVWVNNAGVGAVGEFDRVPLASHERVIETNLLGYVRGAHAVLPHFRERGRGVLINVLSLGSWVSQPYAASYSAAKFGLRGFSDALRGEFDAGSDIHICDVYPSVTDTPALANSGNYTGRELGSVARGIDPRRVARAIVRTSRRPRATTTVGNMARLSRLANAVAPGFSRLHGMLTRRIIQTQPETPGGDGNLFAPPAVHRHIDGGNRRAAPDWRLLAVAGGAIGIGVAAGIWWSRQRGLR